MANYYVNDHAQNNGDHEVHVPSCTFFSSIVSRRYLGEFPSCQPAVQEAKKYYALANGCYYCCPACHTR